MSQCGILIRKIINSIFAVVIGTVLIVYRIVTAICLCLIGMPVILYMEVCMPFLHRIPLLRKTVAAPLEFVFWTISGFLCMPVSFFIRRSRKPCFVLVPVPVFGDIDFNPGASKRCGFLTEWADRNGFRKVFCFQVKEISKKGQCDYWYNLFFHSVEIPRKNERVLAVWYEEERSTLLLFNVVRQTSPTCIDTETIFYTVCNGESRLMTSDNAHLLFGPLNPKCFHLSFDISLFYTKPSDCNTVEAGNKQVAIAQELLLNHMWTNHKESTRYIQENRSDSNTLNMIGNEKMPIIEQIQLFLLESYEQEDIMKRVPFWYFRNGIWHAQLERRQNKTVEQLEKDGLIPEYRKQL